MFYIEKFDLFMYVIPLIIQYVRQNKKKIYY